MQSDIPVNNTVHENLEDENTTKNKNKIGW
jgi:hypothetical protein